MKMVGNLLLFCCCSVLCCAELVFNRSIDRFHGSAKMLVCLRVSIDQPLTLYERARASARPKRRETNTRFVLPVNRQCARFRYPDTQPQPQQRKCVSAKHFLYSFFSEAHFSVMKMAQRTESHTDYKLKTRDLKMYETNEAEKKTKTEKNGSVVANSHITCPVHMTPVARHTLDSKAINYQLVTMFHWFCHSMLMHTAHAHNLTLPYSRTVQ